MQYQNKPLIQRQKLSDLLMDSSELLNLLSYLQRLQESWYSDIDMKDIVRRIELKMNIMISMSPVEHGNQEVSPLEGVIPQLKQLGMDAVCVSADQKSTVTAGETVLSNLEKLRFIKLEMEHMYSVAFKSSRSKNSGSNEDVLNFINVLHENLKNILRSKAGILVPVKPQILALQDELSFLRNFLYFISQICFEQRFPEDLLIFAQAVAVSIAYLLHFLRVDKKMDEEMENGVKTELLDLVEKLNPFQQPKLLKIFLRALEGTNPQLLDLTVMDYECALRFLDSIIENVGQILNKANLELTARNQIKILQEELSSVEFYLMDLPLSDSNEKLDNLMLKIQDLTIQTGLFIYSSICKKDNEFTVLASDEKFKGLQDKIESVKSESDHFIMPRSWQSNFPKTNELEYVDFIIKNLKERLHSISAPIDLLSNEVNSIYEELSALRDDFGQVAKHWNENKELKPLFCRYRDIAYQAEYFVDSLLCGIVPFWSQKMGLVNLVKDLCHIKKELEFILNDNIDHGNGMSVSFISPQAKSLSDNVVLDSEDNVRNTRDEDTNQLVGFEDEVKKIIDELLGGSDQLTILSITGMPGIGKTSVANSVYRDPSVTMQFHARAWCSVSQVYNKENLLLEILHQVKPKSKEDREKNEKCFDQKLYQSLKGKRYLVVLDDIWDIQAWDELRPSFPNDNNGSRIIFTTRNQSIVMQANNVPHALRLLLDEESWKLLQVRIFKEDNCPPQLVQIGKKIAENCKGLPLTVVLAAGLLKVIETKKDSWEQFAKVLISQEVKYSIEQHLGILDLSYRHLPDYLRPCFLYFGLFPEDAIIPVWKLVRLWIAEGFVQPKAGVDSLELEAENYLYALIDRSLVMITKQSYNGRAKSCRIHDLLHDFCTGRAREEMFLMKMKRGHSHSTLTDSEVHEQYRLCIVQSNTLTVPQVRTGHFESRIRSLWFSVGANLLENPSSTRNTLRGVPSSSSFSPPSSYRFSYYNKLRGVEVFLKFRLLKVLDLGMLNIVAEDSFDTITQLVHLRYLSLLAHTRKIPAEIENLKNLETFLLTGTRLGYVALPETIWNMVNLTHIEIKEGATPLFPAEFIENCYWLDSLTSLSTLVLHHGNELEKTMKKLPNLKKLKCTFLGSWDDSETRNPLSVLDFLHQLEELSITSLDQQHIIFPPGLKKLALSDLILSRDEISVIGELPNLEVLKLVNVAMGYEWWMKEGEFKTLKFLTLETIGIRVWVASPEHLPRLEKLVVKVCKYLKELPSIAECPFLRMIDVSYCNTSVVASARKIQEEQDDMGNCHFNLCISGNNSDD